jgi:hypothetical protein
MLLFLPTLILMPACRVFADTTFTGKDPGKNLHRLGTPVGVSSWGAAANSGSGFLTYGPYSSEFENGVFKAAFNLSVDDNSSDDLVVAFIDVYDNASKRQIARREVHRKEFNRPEITQPFDLTFVTLGENNLEFRVYVFGCSYLVHHSTTLTKISSLAHLNLIDSSAVANAHPIGSPKKDRRWSASRQQGQGYLTVIPYDQSLPAGNYSVQCHLLIDDNSLDNEAVARLDISNAKTGAALARLDVKRMSFKERNQDQTFDVPFEYDGSGALLLRIYVYGRAYIEESGIALYPVSQLFYVGADTKFRHDLGRAEGSAWVTDHGKKSGLLTYGPFTTEVPAGGATATFNLSLGAVNPHATQIARIEVFDDDVADVVAWRVINKHDFAAIGRPQDFDLAFDLPEVSSLEFRVHVFGSAFVQHNSTTVYPDRLTLTALWNHAAHLEFRKRNVFYQRGVQDSDTASLNALDGIWYAFNRRPAVEVSSKQASICKKANRDFLEVVVRSSNDRGLNWSDPVVVAAPSRQKNAADSCAIVDGSAFFDAQQDTWHFLAQCLNDKSNWNLCHYSRHGMLPTGVFVPDPANPVVVGGELWNRICAGKSSVCPTSMRDEGTPQILFKNREGYYYVTFHGANYGSVVTGARGVARTRDFVHWQTSAADLPSTAILTANDCNEWDVKWQAGGCIGIGAAQILRSNQYFYLLAEAADRSLGCEKGQNWIFGLLRNTEIGDSGTWQPYPSNPFVTDETPSTVGCDLEYMNFLRDRGEIFLYFALYSRDYPFPGYLYQLVNGAGYSSVLRVH